MGPRVAVAGRLAVHIDGTTTDERALPGRQPRLAFVLLVLERRRTIPRDELADNLWPERRPDTWESALRGVVSRVRTFVVTSGLGRPDELRAETGTYQLALEDDLEVDVERASSLVDRAAAALDGGDAERAVADSESARGVLAQPVLAGVTSPWLEEERRRWEAALRRAVEVLAEARLASGHTAAAIAAAEAAIDLDPFREIAHRVVLRAALVGGDRAAGLQAYERCRRLLADELGADPSPETQALHQELLGVPEPAAGRAVGAPPTSAGHAPASEDVTPYLGLRTFEERDAPWFHGRSADVSRLLDRLAAGRFLAVVGASGSGKSSLVRAGLVAALRRGALPSSDTWPIAVVRPGPQPMQVLTAAVRSLLDDRIGTHAGAVLVVDQLEELFAPAVDDGERRAALRWLEASTVDARRALRVVVTLRADYYHRLTEHPPLADLASAHHSLVTPMDEVGLAAAIEGPAHRAGLRLEPGLTETILRDVARQPGTLPLLEHALLEVWHRAEDGVLTLDGYARSGGVEQALAKRAEHTYLGVGEDDRAVARRVLLRLTHPVGDAADTRRQVTFEELVTGPADRRAVERVVGTLAAARLLTTDARPDGERTVEVAHEALLRAWPRLRGWIDDDRAGLLVHRRLTAAASEWERLGRDEGALFRGGQLAEAQAWAERQPDAANPRERGFLAASLETQATERRRRVRRLRLTAAALSLGMLVAGALSLFAVGQSTRLATEARISGARELAAAAVASLDADPERSILLAIRAVEATFDHDGTALPEAEEALHRALRRSRVLTILPQGGEGLAADRAGRRLVTTGPASDPTATIWDLDRQEPLAVLPAHPGPITEVALHPDGQLVATVASDPTVRLWDVGTGRLVREVAVDEPAGAVGFSPEGRLLAVGGQQGTVTLVDRTTGAVEQRLDAHDWVVTSVAFAPDGSRLVTGGFDGVAHVWDVDRGQRLVTLVGHDWQIEAVAVHPDGHVIATASSDRTVRLWDANDGRHLETLFALAPQRAVAFSPDGTRVAAGGTDGTASVWDASSGELLLSLAGHTSDVTGLVFVAEGDHLLTTGLDSTTRRWDVSRTGTRDLATAPSAYLRFAGVAFSPDGRRLAVPLDEDGVAIHDSRTGEQLGSLMGHPERLVGLTFDPEGGRLAGTLATGWFSAANTDDHRLPVWDVGTGELLVRLAGHDDYPTAALFGPGPHQLVSGGHEDDASVRVWDLRTGDEVDRVDVGNLVLALDVQDGHWLAVTDDGGDALVWDGRTRATTSVLAGDGQQLRSVAIGPDGLLATGHADGTVRIWDHVEGELRTTVDVGTQLGQLAFSPDGTLLAVAGEDGLVRVVDVASGLPRLTLHGHQLIAHGVAFSPDGRLLASTSPDGTVAVHLLPIGEALELARTRVTRALTDEECRRFLPSPACPDGDA